MTAADWHRHAQHVAPQPALSLLPPLTDLVVRDEEPLQRTDSDDAVLAAQVADEITVLTRVLLGLGLPEPERVEQEAAALAVEPVAPLPSYDAAAFVAPPVVEVEPLVPPASVAARASEPEPLPEPLPEPEPVRRDPQTILDELAFLDS